MPNDSLAGVYRKDIPGTPLPVVTMLQVVTIVVRGQTPEPVDPMETRMVQQLAASGVTRFERIFRGNEGLKRCGFIGVPVAYEH
jgi:hypothetical protein